MNKENLPLNKKGMAIGRHSKKKWQREQLIVAILQQPTWQKAAASIGISEVTAWRIRQTPAFRREYLQARREAMSQWGPVMPVSFTRPSVTLSNIAAAVRNLRRSPDLTFRKLVQLGRLFT